MVKKKKPKVRYKPLPYKRLDAHPNLNVSGWLYRIVSGLHDYLRGPASEVDFDRDILPMIRDLTFQYVDNVSTLLDAKFGKGEKEKWQRYAQEAMGEA